jgi:hypothetical protein
MRLTIKYAFLVYATTNNLGDYRKYLQIIYFMMIYYSVMNSQKEMR